MSDLEWEPILDDKGCCPHGNYDWRSCVRCHGWRIPVPEAENAEPEADNAKLKEATQAVVNRMKQLDRVGTKLPDILHSDVNALAALDEELATLVEGRDCRDTIAQLEARIAELTDKLAWTETWLSNATPAKVAELEAENAKLKEAAQQAVDECRNGVGLEYMGRLDDLLNSREEGGRE